MIAPSPYGRPARDREPAGRPARRPAAPPPGPADEAADLGRSIARLDLELLRRFARGHVTLCQLMGGFRPDWAWASYGRLLDRGLIEEHPDDRRVTLTAAGWEELSR